MKADHALVGVDGRMISGSPVGPFKITVDQEVVNWILPS